MTIQTPISYIGRDLIDLYLRIFNYNPYYLTSTEIYRLHRRFGHLLAEKLYRVLKYFKHNNINRKAIDYLTKYYFYY